MECLYHQIIILDQLIAEIMVNGSKHKLIKKRQSLENLINN